MMKMLDRRGFTLIELLVVIAIIAILAAILFPIFLKAKESSQISKCISNMKQIGAATAMYMGDSDDRFPPSVNWGPESTYPNVLFSFLKKYAKNSPVATGAAAPSRVYSTGGIFACPADFGLPMSMYSIPKDKTLWWYIGCSYEFYGTDQTDYGNFLGGGQKEIEWTGLSYKPRSVDPSQTAQGAPMSAVRSPSKKAMLGDTWYWHSGDQSPDPSKAWRNTLYVDGHARRCRYREHVLARVEALSQNW